MSNGLTYGRTPSQRGADREKARAIEDLVGTWLGDWKITETDSIDRLDFWVPGVYVEVKGKFQKITPRWHKLPGVAEPDLFIIDELSIRKALAHFPSVYFILFDRMCARVFWARVDEVACGDRYRADRVGVAGHKKGKWVVNLAQFRQLHKGDHLLSLILADQIATPWKGSQCLSQQEVPQV